jgi:hypothetical protein
MGRIPTERQHKKSKRQHKKFQVPLKPNVTKYFHNYIKENNLSIPFFFLAFYAGNMYKVSNFYVYKPDIPDDITIQQLLLFAESEDIGNQKLLFLGWTHFGPKGVPIYKKLASKGDMYAQILFGLYTHHINERVRLLSTPAKQGNPIAQYELVINQGGSPNIHLFLESAARSGALAAVELYLKYLLFQNDLHQFLKFLDRERPFGFENKVEYLFGHFVSYRESAKNSINTIFKYRST